MRFYTFNKNVYIAKSSTDVKHINIMHEPGDLLQWRNIVFSVTATQCMHESYQSRILKFILFREAVYSYSASRRRRQ